MDVSQATAMPSKGTIDVLVGSDDEGTDLSTSHLIAPWPVDENCRDIAISALEGMGWTVVGGGTLAGEAGDPDAALTFDVRPAR